MVALTALDLEYDAIRSHLVDHEYLRHQMGTLFEVGTLPGSPWLVALAVTGPGNQRAAALAERAIAMFDPVAMLIVGVAGALKGDLALGDVVVATRIHSYHGGTDDDGGFHARPAGSNASHELEQLARFVARSRSWKPGSSEVVESRVHFRPIAAGDVVLNSRQTMLARQLRDTYNDAAAIEMESAGATIAAELNKACPMITIRGVSDKADGLKHVADGARWQPVAAANAAKFAMALVAQMDPFNFPRHRPPARAVRGSGVPGPLGGTGVPILGYHERPGQYEKALMVDAATEEVIDLGTALNTCSYYLVTTERPARYRQAVVDLLARGGRYCCVLLDPDSSVARDLGRVRAEDLPRKIRRSLARFQRFKASGLTGVENLEIRLTDGFAGVATLAVDLGHQHATLLYSSYINSTGAGLARLERGDMPHYLVTPAAESLFDLVAGIVSEARAQSYPLVATGPDVSED